MSNEPSQKVMLYFLELLMNTKKTLTVSQLAGHFGNGFFTAEMRAAAGVNEKGLREFLLRHPSLFTVQGNVSLYTEDDKPGRQPRVGLNQSQRTLPEVCLELEAVKYLAQKLANHRGNWVVIQSLTGHFSQMTAEMRRVIGPQADLKKFLMRHEHVFEVCVNSVRLREELESVLSLEPESFTFIPPVAFKDPAFCSLYSISKTDMEEIPQNNGLSLRESIPNWHSEPGKQHSEMNQDEDTGLVTPNSASTANYFNHTGLKPSSTDQCSSSVTMTLTEYSAVLFLKNYLEEKGCMKVCGLMEYVDQRATETIRNFLGSSEPYFKNFLNKYPQIFSISSEEIIGLVKNAKVCVIVTSYAQHSRNIEEFRQFQTMLELCPKSTHCLDNPKHKLVQQIHQDKENVIDPFEDCFQKPIGALRDLKNLTVDSSHYRSHRRNFPTSQKFCVLEADEDLAKTYASIGCQTLATGDIIATQFYRGN